MTDRDGLGAPQRPTVSLILATVLAIALFVLFVYAVLLGRDAAASDSAEAESAASGAVAAELVEVL